MGVKTERLKVRFPSAPDKYDQLGEAVFRNDLERILDTLSGTFAALKQEIEDELTGPIFPTVTGTQEFRLTSADLALVAEGVDVASWIDKWSGYDFAGGTTNPQYNLNIFGELPGVQFDGATDRLFVDRGAQATPGAFTFFFAFKTPSAWPANNNTLLQLSDAAGANRQSVVARRNAGSFRLAWWDTTAGWLESATTLATDTSYILSAASDNSDMLFKVNGGTVEDLGNPTLQLMEVFNLGSSFAETEPVGAYFGEVILYSTKLSVADVVLVEEYLRKVYQ